MPKIDITVIILIEKINIMPVTRNKRRKKRVVESNPFNFESTVVPTPEEIVPKTPKKHDGSLGAKKLLNKKVVSKKEFHRTSNK